MYSNTRNRKASWMRHGSIQNKRPNEVHDMVRHGKKLEIARFGMTRPRSKIDTIRLDTVISHYRHDTLRHGMSEYQWVRTRLDTEPSTDDTVGHGFKWMQTYFRHGLAHSPTRLDTVCVP